MIFARCRFYDFFLFFCCRKSSAQCYSSSCCNHNTTVDLRNKRAKNNYTFPSCNNFFAFFFLPFAYESFLCYSICCFEYKLIFFFFKFSRSLHQLLQFAIICSLLLKKIAFFRKVFRRNLGFSKEMSLDYFSVNLHVFMLVNDRQIEMLLKEG